MAAVSIGWNEILKRTSAEVYRSNCLEWAAELAAEVAAAGSGMPPI